MIFKLQEVPFHFIGVDNKNISWYNDLLMSLFMSIPPFILKPQQFCGQEPFVNIPEDLIREALKVVLGIYTWPTKYLFGGGVVIVLLS